MKYTFEAPVILVARSNDEVVYGGKLESDRINMFIKDDGTSQLADYLHDDSGLDEVVTSIIPTTKFSGDDLISVTVCETTSPLSDEQVKTLSNYITGQFSDGWGEGFEQQEIPASIGYIYASFWSGESGWEIKLV